MYSVVLSVSTWSGGKRVCSTHTVSRQEELRPSGANSSFLLCSQQHKVYAVLSSFFFAPLFNFQKICPNYRLKLRSAEVWEAAGGVSSSGWVLGFSSSEVRSAGFLGYLPDGEHQCKW